MPEPLPLPSSVVSTDRGAQGRGYYLITPANQFPAKLPHLTGTQVVKLASPRNGSARFAWFHLETHGGTTTPISPGFEHFFYVLSGELTVNGTALASGGFAFVPDSEPLSFQGEARAAWIKQRHQPAPGVEAPAATTGSRETTPAGATSVPGLTRRNLIDPDDARFDFAMDLLEFQPGVVMRKVEIHDEEHGLYMTKGAGIYHLDRTPHEVRQDDFIYMAPYCPQYFYATGWEPSEYLLYKDVFRDGF
jgi:(S)-ureidoglycine aminohydrolase